METVFSASSTNDAEKTVSICRRLKLDPGLSPCTKINSKWIKDLDVRSETVKFIQEKLGDALDYIGTGNNFMNRTPIARHLKVLTNGTT
jgi:hypothetical protein